MAESPIDAQTHDTDDAGTGEAPQPVKPFKYVHSTNFPALLEQLGISLAVSTYQAGKLMIVRAAGGKLSTLLRSFEQPMGLAIDPQRRYLAVGTRRMVWFLHSAPEIAPQLEPKGLHDACYVPRYSHVTGDFRGHEMAWVGDQLWIVNTRFSCLCTLDPEYSFVPRWKPPFVDQLVAEDRCHINGIAVDNGQIAYLTAHGHSNEKEGWRQQKRDGGIVMHVPTGEIVTKGLSMPHSPRMHEGRLYVLNSGHGQVCTLDPQSGKIEVITQLPGYTRGLAFAGPIAFVGLSKVRETKTFGGVPIAESNEPRQCGIWAVDLRNGQTVGFMQFESGCEELFDIKVLDSMKWPSVVGFQKNTINGIFVAPSDAWKQGATLPGV